MKEIGMLFNGAMVRAVLDGSKVQTRRIVKPAPQMVADKRIEPWAGNPAALLQLLLASKRGCPYGKPGDQIWVRETWRTDASLDAKPPRDFSGWPVKYEADGAALRHGAHFGKTDGKTRVCMHMPRWACRILLEIVSVRVERMQDISDVDILAEGIDTEKLAESQDKFDALFRHGEADGRPTLRSAWRDLWESTGGDWDANEWLWVIEFKRVTP